MKSQRFIGIARVAGLLLGLGSVPAHAIPHHQHALSAGHANAESGAPARIADLFGASRAETAIPVRLAHAILVKANPEKEATITDVPEEVLLIFNDAVGEEFLALAVVDETGKRVDKHDAKLDFTDRSHLRASVEKMPPGKYTVRYRVLSADGHVVSGKYFFQVQGK